MVFFFRPWTFGVNLKNVSSNFGVRFACDGQTRPNLTRQQLEMLWRTFDKDAKRIGLGALRFTDVFPKIEHFQPALSKNETCNASRVCDIFKNLSDLCELEKVFGAVPPRMIFFQVSSEASQDLPGWRWKCQPWGISTWLTIRAPRPSVGVEVDPICPNFETPKREIEIWL